MSNLEKRIQVGPCSASVFVRQVETQIGTVPMYDVVLQRAYKDKDGNYQNTNNYRMNDLPKAILALQKAYEHVVMETRDSVEEKQVET